MHYVERISCVLVKTQLKLVHKGFQIVVYCILAGPSSSTNGIFRLSVRLSVTPFDYVPIILLS